jgi:hypothetical protein
MHSPDDMSLDSDCGIIYWQRKTEELGETLCQCHFVHHKSHMDWPGREPGPPRWEVSDWQPETWHGTDWCITYLCACVLLRVTGESTIYAVLRFLLPALQCTSRGSYLCVIGADHGGSTHTWNVGQHLLDYTAVRPSRLQTLFSPSREPEISHNIYEVLV